nr:reverse transcriptase domain-containing protein [Tanacetum cinerariifolium]
MPFLPTFRITFQLFWIILLLPQEKPILMLRIIQSIKFLRKFSPFYNMKGIQAFYAKELPIPPPVILPPSLVLSQSPISDSQDFFPSEEISPKNIETYVSPSSSIGSSLPYRMPPKRTSTSESPAITLATIQRLITDGIAVALETRAINTNNTNRNLEPKETPIAKRGNYKEFISCQRFYFNGTEGTIGLIHWFEHGDLYVEV